MGQLFISALMHKNTTNSFWTENEQKSRNSSFSMKKKSDKIWMEIRNLDEIIDETGDFASTKMIF